MKPAVLSLNRIVDILNKRLFPMFFPNTDRRLALG